MTLPGTYRNFLYVLASMHCSQAHATHGIDNLVPKPLMHGGSLRPAMGHQCIVNVLSIFIGQG